MCVGNRGGRICDSCRGRLNNITLHDGRLSPFQLFTTASVCALRSLSRCRYKLWIKFCNYDITRTCALWWGTAGPVRERQGAKERGPLPSGKLGSDWFEFKTTTPLTWEHEKIRVNLCTRIGKACAPIGKVWSAEGAALDHDDHFLTVVIVNQWGVSNHHRCTQNTKLYQNTKDSTH